MMEKLIDKFEGDFDFLSNFSPHSFRDDSGVLWKTSEHYYQALKTIDMVERGEIWSVWSPGMAKKIGQTVTMREHWNETKLAFMTDAVNRKFMQNKDIRDLLISTKGYQLIEGNSWHDNIWGDCDCLRCLNTIGKNLLGHVLMIIRGGFIDGE